jgi:hypothetical protein
VLSGFSVDLKMWQKVWSPLSVYVCGAPAFSHHYTVSLVQWVNRLLPA